MYLKYSKLKCPFSGTKAWLKETICMIKIMRDSVKICMFYTEFHFLFKYCIKIEF